jgi:ferritin-like metal-binding protein YciE
LTLIRSRFDELEETERMVTMIDQIYDRQYREARGRLNASAARGLSGFGKAIREAFEVLVGIEYSAPWTAKPKRARSH